MRLPATVKWILSIPLVLANTALLLLVVWLIGTELLVAFEVRWWAGLFVTFVATTFLTALVVVSAGHIRHLHDMRDPQKVLVCSLHGLWVNLTGVVLGVLILISFLLLAAVTVGQ